MHETTPSLLAAARAAGLEVLEAPLIVLDRAAWRPPTASGADRRHARRRRSRARGRARRPNVAFAAAGTAPGPQGIAERDAASDDGDLEFLRGRLRSGATRMAVAAGGGPVAAGAHQPVGAVSEIVGVATLPAVRRQGVGGAVTGALVRDALERVRTVFLSAGSEDIARVYARLGFRRVGTACIVG